MIGAYHYDAVSGKFTGKERDSESGLDNFGFRYYGSSMGRFSSPDEPFYNGDLKNPQSLNLYAYVQNNPLKNTDPDGHDVRVCVEGADKCVNYTDDQYKALLAAQNGKQGIDLPTGNMPTGDITCGGKTCGTAEYFEPGLDPSDNFTAVGAIAGAQGAGAIVGWVRTGAEFLNGLFGSRGASTTGTVGGRATFQDLLQGTVKDASGQSTKNGGFAQATKDFESLEGKSQNLGRVQLKELPDGGKAVLRNFSNDGRPTLEYQPSTGGSKTEWIRYNP